MRNRHNSFRHDVEKELARQKKTSFATVGMKPSSYLTITHLFENFLIFGKSSQADTSPQILFMYPEQLSFPDITIAQISESCYPTGINRDFLNKHNETIQDAFCFSMIPSGQERFHFVCLHVSPNYGKLPFYIHDDELKDNCFCLCLISRCPFLTSHLSFLFNVINSVPRHSPGFSLFSSHHFGKTYSNSDLDYIDPSAPVLRSSKSLPKPKHPHTLTEIELHQKIPSRPHFENTFDQDVNNKANNKTNINQNDDINQDDNNTENNNAENNDESSPLAPTFHYPPKSESKRDPLLKDLIHHSNFLVYPSLYFLPTLVNFLEDYTEIPDEDVCHIGKTFDINLPTVEKAIVVSTIEILFSLLSVSDIIGLMTALLLDAQVVVIGKSLRDISYTIWGLTSLLPFPYVGTLVPLLSTLGSHLDLLQAPTPFLIGVPLCPQFEKIQFYETTVFVNLEKGVVSFQEFFSNPSLKYPHFASVVKDIETLIKPKFLSQTPDNQFSLPQPLKALGKNRNFTLEMIDQIINIVRAPFEHLLGDSLPCFFVTDANSSDFETIFNKNLFLQVIDESDSPFFQEFLTTQEFLTFINQKLLSFIKSQKVTPASQPPTNVRKGLVRRMTSISQIPGFL